MKRGGLLVLYDRDCGLCSRIAQALRILDWRQQLSLVPLQEASATLGGETPSVEALLEALHVRRAAGTWLRGGAAALAIADAIPALVSLGWAGRLPILRHLVEPTYQAVARHRDRLGRWFGASRCRFPGDQAALRARRDEPPPNGQGVSAAG